MKLIHPFIIRGDHNQLYIQPDMCACFSDHDVDLKIQSQSQCVHTPWNDPTVNTDNVVEQVWWTYVRQSRIQSKHVCHEQVSVCLSLLNLQVYILKNMSATLGIHVVLAMYVSYLKRTFPF